MAALFPRSPPRFETIEALSHEYPDVDPSAIHTSLALMRVGSELLEAFEHTFASHGLSSGRFAVMMTLRRNPDGLSPAELADLVCVTRPTMTGLLDTLDKGGLIERRPHPEDHRAQTVSLSRSGRALLHRMLPSHFRRHAALMAGLSRAERDELVRLLMIIQPRIPQRETP